MEEIRGSWKEKLKQQIMVTTNNISKFNAVLMPDEISCLKNILGVMKILYIQGPEYYHMS